MDLLNFLLTPEANNAYQVALGQAPAITNGKVPEAAADINFTDADYKKSRRFSATIRSCRESMTAG